MLVGAYPPTVQEWVWTNLQEEYRSWKGIVFKAFCENEIAQGHHLLSIPMHRDKKNCEKKGRKRATSSEDAGKEEEPAHQGHL